MAAFRPVVGPAGGLFVHLPCGATTWWRDAPAFAVDVAHALTVLPPDCDACGAKDANWHRVYVEK